MKPNCNPPNGSVTGKVPVSVIVPTYNRASLLAEALESVRKQTYRPIELIVVDDGSDDDTHSVVRRFTESLKNDEGLDVFFFRQEHSGAQVARNLGLKKSGGKYIQFLDSDDFLLPQKTEWGVERLETSGADLIYFRTQLVDQDLRSDRKPVTGRPAYGTARDIVDHLWHTSGTLFRKEFLEKVGPWLETLDVHQQWEYAARIKLASPYMIFDSRIASCFRSHQGPRISNFITSGTDHKSLERALDNLAQTATRLGVLNPGLSRMFQRRYVKVASSYLESKNLKECFRCLEKVISLRANKKLIWCIARICHSLKSPFLIRIVAGVLRVRRALRIRINERRNLSAPVVKNAVKT